MPPKIYLAGVTKAFVEAKGEPLMISFAYPQQMKLIKLNFSDDFLVDSGAFSVWRQGGKIDIEKYIHFINHHDEERIKGFISLDVLEGSSKENLENYTHILSKVNCKDKIIPVFHEGDPWSLLTSYLKLKPKTIAVGLIENRGMLKGADYLEEFFSHLGRAKVQVHGLGITRESTLRQFKDRFHSVDSTSWLNISRYGAKTQYSMIDRRSRAFKRRLGVACIKGIFES